MKRYYYISSDLRDLQAVKSELERAGIDALQIHVLSHRDADVENHRLPEVIFMKRDMVRSALVGAAAGVLAFMAVLAAAYLTGWVQTSLGWIPFLFLALVLLGFFTWEGGFRGIQEPNQRFLRFQKLLADGQHIFYVDVEGDEQRMLEEIAARHPRLEPAGSEKSVPHFLVRWQKKYANTIKALP